MTTPPVDPDVRVEGHDAARASNSVLEPRIDPVGDDEVRRKCLVLEKSGGHDGRMSVAGAFA